MSHPCHPNKHNHHGIKLTYTLCQIICRIQLTPLNMFHIDQNTITNILSVDTMFEEINDSIFMVSLFHSYNTRSNYSLQLT